MKLPLIKMEEGEEVARDGSSWNVLVVDADESSLLDLEKVLQLCNHTVIKCRDDEQCIQMLRENNDAFHIVFIDGNVSSMGGFQLCRLVREQTRIPIILMMSSKYSNVDTVQKALDHGACDILVKPIEIDTITSIDLNALRTRGALTKQQEDSRPNSRENVKASHEHDDQSGKLERNHNSAVKLPLRKKPRVIWTTELHNKFVAAVEKLGVGTAVPKKIMEIMNVPDITRENVASHLQKYRHYLRKKQGNTTKEQVHSTRQTKRNTTKAEVLPRRVDESARGGFTTEPQHSILQGSIDAIASCFEPNYGGTLMTSDMNPFSGLYSNYQNHDYNGFVDANNAFVYQHPLPPLIPDPIEMLDLPMSQFPDLYSDPMSRVPEVYPRELSVTGYEDIPVVFSSMQEIKDRLQHCDLQNFENPNFGGMNAMQFDYSTSGSNVSTLIFNDNASATLGDHYIDQYVPIAVSTPIFNDQAAATLVDHYIDQNVPVADQWYQYRP